MTILSFSSLYMKILLEDVCRATPLSRETSMSFSSPGYKSQCSYATYLPSLPAGQLVCCCCAVTANLGHWESLERRPGAKSIASLVFSPLLALLSPFPFQTSGEGGVRGGSCSCFFFLDAFLFFSPLVICSQTKALFA